MKPEAYTLREWLVFLYNKGLTLFDGSDELLEQFRVMQGWPDEDGPSKKNGKTKKEPVAVIPLKMRIERKCHQIFELYRILPEAMPFRDKGNSTPVFVGENHGSRRYPITSKVTFSRRKKREYICWARSERIIPFAKPPVAANEKEVIRLFGHLRQDAFRIQKKLKLEFPREKDQVRADRNWLIANVMAKAGLRCEEVADLTVHQLAVALHEAGVTDKTLDLHEISDRDSQKKITARIMSLMTGREHAFLTVTIVGKGRKTRHVPFPPDLIVDLLDIGIWGCRRKQIAAWKSRDPGYVPPLALFLSHKGKRELDAGSLGDIIGKAFRQCLIRKGAHKLRGYFATRTAAALWREYFAANQFRFDQVLVNKVLDELARAMGHAQINTTVQFYVDQQLLAHLTKIGTPQAELFRKLWDTLVMGRRHLSERETKLLLTLAERIADAGEGSMLFEVLEAVVEDSRLNPTRRSTKRLELVSDVV